MMKDKILVVEDDLNLSFLLLEILQKAGYEVRLAKNGLAGKEYFSRERFDLVILDIMMPKVNGYDVAKYLRDCAPHLPFIFLSAKTMKEDRLKGYALGAEDFITKPFDEEELLCKIEVIMRRHRESTADLPENYQLGSFLFDFRRQDLWWRDEKIRLTEKENDILLMLCQHQNEILKREEAVEKLYGKRDYFLGRSFDVYISRLRKILSREPNIGIENVYKVGFILKTGHYSGIASG